MRLYVLAFGAASLVVANACGPAGVVGPPVLARYQLGVGPIGSEGPPPPAGTYFRSRSASDPVAFSAEVHERVNHQQAELERDVAAGRVAPGALEVFEVRRRELDRGLEWVTARGWVSLAERQQIGAYASGMASLRRHFAYAPYRPPYLRPGRGGQGPYNYP
jgi:hypothetical protein